MNDQRYSDFDDVSYSSSCNTSVRTLIYLVFTRGATDPTRVPVGEKMW